MGKSRTRAAHALQNPASDLLSLCRLIAARRIPAASLAALGLAFAPHAQAATITVTSTGSSGTGSTLTWSSADSSTANVCTASGTPSNNTWSGTRSPKGGHITVTKIAAATYTYSLSCTNAAGTDSKSATLTVN